MVGLLELTGQHGVEAVPAGQDDALLGAGELPDLKALREQYAPREARCPEVEVQMPPVAVYEKLLRAMAP
ncbi:hypothetical protein AWB72_03354 [Caballeronia concitans]|uniref:Uncharacterized protein n=1 Tax=Caballeronia concitans TaxID=1777133 RepID=A0A658QZ88_9BURK|nr:hypothetical protein AWB72_03354 [Caballeronia concitans]